MPADPVKRLAKLTEASKQAETEKEWAWGHAAEIYRERDLLVRALSKLYPSHLAPRAGHQPKGKTAWVVCIHIPGSQLAWSLPAHMLPLYDHLERTDNDWDRHKTAERFERLEAL